MAQNASTLKYCLTLEIVFVHFRQDVESCILKLCFFTTKCAIFIFTGPVDLAKNQSLYSKHSFISTSKFQLCELYEFVLKKILRLCLYSSYSGVTSHLEIVNENLTYHYWSKSATFFAIFISNQGFGSV